MVDYYRLVPDPATEVIVAEVPVARGRLLFGNILGLAVLDDSVDLVVSLCRTGFNDRVAAARHVDYWLTDIASLRTNPLGPEVAEDAAALVALELAQGHAVFVHCAVGRSRSPAVGAIAISVLENVSMEAARDRVLKALPTAVPLVFE